MHRHIATAASLLIAASLHAQDVPSGFIAETVVSGINGATALAIAPDGRVFFAEQTGAIRVFENDQLVSEPALDLSDRLDTYWERGLIGLTLHPDFPSTPHVFVVYVAKEPFTHHVVSRFIMAGNSFDPDSEQVLLEGDDQSKLGGFKPSGHQGGPIRIGPDNKLYIGIGEQTAGAPSQALDSLLGKILRLNLDGTIPDDNPFFNQTSGKYRAIWAYGIRNPFGMVFEPENDRLWVTDVGQTSWEEVNIIQKGGNYGWPDAEGFSSNESFINPVHAYPPAIGRSIVGGMFFPSAPVEGEEFPERWRGRFFFADWANHWIKALDPDNPDDVIGFARNLNGPVALEPAPDGSLYVLNRGTIWRDPAKFAENSGSLVRIRHIGSTTATASGIASAPPNDLSATRLLSSVTPFQPAGRFMPIDINCPPWQPGVRISYWLSVPDGKSISIRDDGEWEFPAGSIAISYAELDGGTRGDAAFETHVLWFNGPRTVRAGAYRWNTEGTRATLVQNGEIIPLPGQAGRQWFSPGAEMSLNLDLVVTGFQLPLNTRQVHRDRQIHTMNEKGWFSPALVDVASLPRLAAVDDQSATLEHRVRSYLDVNCASCHRPGGSSRGNFDARFITPLEAQNLVNSHPIAGDLGISGATILTPGNPGESLLLQRITRKDFYRMPPVFFTDEPSPLIPILEEWIESLASPEN